MIVAKVSAQLAKIVGVPYLSRKEGLAKVWEYIKLHNLQNPANKAEIKPDAALYDVFKQDSVYMTQVMKLLKPHYEQNMRLTFPKPLMVKPEPFISPALKNIVGEVGSRNEALRKIWAHIKENNLQNPEVKSEIMCDAKLHALCHKKTIHQTELMGLVSKHYLVFVAKPEPMEPVLEPI